MLKPLMAIVTACAFLAVPQLVLCEEHLVTTAAAQTRLAQSATQRQSDVRLLQGVLSTTQAARAANTLGVSVDRTRDAVATLSDQELRDLAARASALGLDPTSGYHDYAYHDFMMIFLVVLLVVATIAVVDRY